MTVSVVFLPGCIDGQVHGMNERGEASGGSIWIGAACQKKPDTLDLVVLDGCMQSVWLRAVLRMNCDPRVEQSGQFGHIAFKRRLG